MDVTEEELQPLYDYVDEIPLSRPKRNIARDFADGVLVAEILHYEQPRLIELHNYSSANSIPQKMYNWSTLNQKVFKRHLGFVLAKQELDAVCSCEVGAIERVLKLLRLKLEQYKSIPHQERDEVNSVHQESGARHQNLADDHVEQHALHQPSVTATLTLSSGLKRAKPGVEEDTADQVIKELQGANELLVLKTQKLEQLVRLKDAKINTLSARLGEAGLA